MHKTKKKTKTAKLPKPIKVKKEKSDEDRLPQPMTHYIDDRLEMVKQIFNTLKPKTIVNLAPDFLKTQALEEIEEACLNELLCISTKRLKSIITATKCPTDTESSDNDSDVERHEEHISLEEISSDSEIEGSNSKKVKKKKASKTLDDTEAAKKDAANPDNAEDGQISVLELLELQARARAIRSQLALEPVTKIEVESDGEKRNDDKSKSSDKGDKPNKNDRKRLSSERQSRDSAKVSRSNGSMDTPVEKDAEAKTSKKIKLKRSYKSSTSTEKGDEIAEKLDSGGKKKDKPKEGKEKSDKATTKEKSKEQGKSKNKEHPITEIKKEKSSRSPSPDVIPIVAEPETLLITDSEEENEQGNKEAKKATDERNEIQTQRERKNTETERTEKVTESTEYSSAQTSEQPTETPIESEAAIVTDNVSIEASTENTQDSQFKMSDKDDTQDTQDSNIKSIDLKMSSKEKTKTDETNSANHSDDDQNDDVISLGGDLENEMNEQLENEVKAQQLPSQDNNKSQDESQAEEAISLESSEDERVNDNQSWHSRYMKSSKVSKVLAASRLGKRVRDKIKKSKHSKKETSHENSDAEKEKPAPVFSSKHEDGSIEQYKELLEMRQRKSSSNL